MIDRNQITRRIKLAILAVLAGLLASIVFTGCAIPVSVRPESDAAGKPIPAPVSIELRQDANGRPIPLAVAETQPAPLQARPEFADVASRAAPLPVPVGFDWSGILAILGITAGALGGGWGLIAQRGIGILKTALTATAVHADRMETAETDADVAKAKAQSHMEQSVMGVLDVIAKARGKA